MSELFSHMLQRHQGTVPMVKPRRPSRFETTRPAFTAIGNPVNGEEHRPVEEAEQQSPAQNSAAQPPAPPSLAADQGEMHLTAPPAATGKLRYPPEPTTPRLHLAAVAPEARQKASPPQAAADMDASRPWPPRIDHGDQVQPRQESDTFSRPAPMALEVRQRFVTLIARSAERPHEQKVHSLAAHGWDQGATNTPVPPASPENGAAAPAAEPSGGPSLSQGRKPMIDTVRPAATIAPTRNTPPAPASANLSSEISAGKLAAPLDQEPFPPLEEDDSRFGEYLLVPPGRLTRMQIEFQRSWSAMEHDSKPEPTINVTIGRVEVRAEAPPAPQKPRAREKAVPVMSLDEYLSQRKGRS